MAKLRLSTKILFRRKKKGNSVTSKTKGSLRKQRLFKRKKKGNSVISRAKGSVRKKSTPPSSPDSVYVRYDLVQLPALVSVIDGSIDLNEDYDDNEKLLRQFDLNIAYGPCIGMSRLGRWNRAENFGLSPPAEVLALLLSGKVQPECLWYGLF